MDKDLISRSGVLKSLSEALEFLRSNRDLEENFIKRCVYGLAIMDAEATVDLIKAEPAVDAVEVVRCGECKSLYDGSDDYCCANHKGLTKITPDTYCSYGERITQ